MIRRCVGMRNVGCLLRTCSSYVNDRLKKAPQMSFCGTTIRNATTVAASQEGGTMEKGPPSPVGKIKKEKKTRTSKKGSTPPTGKETKTKLKVAVSASAQLILNYVDKHSGIRSGIPSSLLPKQLLKSTSIAPASVYLIDKKEAKHFSKAIMLENPDREFPVVEFHAGLGLLTGELVEEIGFKYVTCLEDCSSLAEGLASRFNISVIDCSLDDLPRHHHLDKHDGGERVNSILTSITTGEDCVSGSSFESKRKLYMIGAIPTISMINFLIRCYVTKRVFFEDELPWSGVTLFVALGAKPALICTATPETGLVAYRPTSVFFQTLFTMKEIGTLSRKAFIPWETEDLTVRKGPKKRKLNVEDPTVLRLMKIEINYETQEQIGKDNLFAYWYFVRQHLYARTNRIIPELERWVPGCGVRLIKQGFTIFSQFGTLKPDEILKLYLQFVSWPEFANSSFLNAVEKFQTRLELTEEEEDNK